MPELASPANLCVEPEPAVSPLEQLSPKVTLPISVIIPVKNEARNLRSCLESLRGTGEIYVVDSQSTDATVPIGRSFGAQVIQFHYHGGWPKKRQWALENLPLRYEWVLLLDADESLTPELISEIRHAIADPEIDGYYVGLQVCFLGRRLRHCGAGFYKLSLFRRGIGHFECRSPHQDASMCDMEVHEHVIVNGAAKTLNHQLVHRNIDSLARYIQKHNQYSNWEALVWNTSETSNAALPPKFFGSQAQRRRWLRQKFFRLPGSSLFLFLYRYILRLGFLDGVPGLIYCGFQAIQFFQVKAKLYEAKIARATYLPSATSDFTPVQDSHVRH